MKCIPVILCCIFIFTLSACGGGSSGSDDGDDGDDGGVSVSGANPCGTVIDIGPSSIIDGRLEAGDCLVSDVDPVATNGTSFVDEYRVTLDSMGTLTISAKSADLDLVLALLNRSTSCSSGCTPAQAMVIAADDDPFVEDALISMDLVAGTYLIAVISFSPGTGSYTLETSF